MDTRLDIGYDRRDSRPPVDAHEGHAPMSPSSPMAASKELTPEEIKLREKQLAIRNALAEMDTI